MSARSRFLPSPAGCAGVLMLIVVALYARTLSFEFVFDDWHYIAGNSLLHDARSFLFPFHFTSFATSGVQQGIDPDLALNFILRPVTYFTFFLNHVQGGADPWGFRMVNIVIHAINAALVYTLIRLVIRAAARGDAGQNPRAGSLASFAGAALFAMHPMQVESVTYVTQRFESLATLFYLGSCTAWLSALMEESTNNKRARKLRHVSIVLLVTGMLSKETVITAPVIMVVLDVLCLRGGVKAACRRALVPLLCMALPLVLLAAASRAQNGGTLDLTKTVNITNVDLTPVTPWQYALTQIGASVGYLGLWLWPQGQNADADFHAVTSALDWRVLAPAAVIAGLLVLAWWAYVKIRRDWTGAALAGGTLFYFIALAPSSSFIPLPDLFVEHRSYLPSVGLALAAAALMELLRRAVAIRGWPERTIPAALTCAVLMLGAATWMRNDAWSTEVTFWQDAVAKSPHKARPWQSLGTALAASGDKATGLECLHRAIEIDPRFLPAWVNASVICIETRQFDEAVKTSRAALAWHPAAAVLHHNLGIALAHTGLPREAIASFLRAIDALPASADSHLCVGLLYERLNDSQHALEHLRQAAVLRPDDEQMHSALADAEARLAAVSQN